MRNRKLIVIQVRKKIIKLLKRKKNRLFSDINVVTEDEKWLHYFQPQRKLNNIVWMTKHGKHPLIAKRFQITKKKFHANFFVGIVLCCYFLFTRRRRLLLERCTNVNKHKQQYKMKCLKTGIKGLSIMLQPTSQN